MAIRTIFSMAEDCAAGRRLGWSEFIRDYGEITRTLLLHYFPVLQPDLAEHIAGVFQRARLEDNAWFRGLKFSNEREFLVAFRELLFAYSREHARLPVPELSLEQMREIMKDLSVVEREVLWLFMKGYTAEQIAPIMSNAEATARAVKQVADQRLIEIVPAATRDAFNISARVLIEAAEKAGRPECLPWKTFNNIINGQISWRERELAEAHILQCFYCIDRFTSFQEMIQLRKTCQPWTSAQVEPVLDSLHLPAEKSKGLFSRILAK